VTARRGTVVIDALPECAGRYIGGHAIVVVDVIRAATTAATALATGRRCFPVPSLDAAAVVAAQLRDPLLVGEQRGRMPAGFHLNNSPAALVGRADVGRPMVLLSSSGTKLMATARMASAAYVGCFRNAAFLATHLAGRHPRVAVLGAGSKGEFREEDQICCAWIAAGLLAAGYKAADSRTREIVARWYDAPAEACVEGKSAAFLRRSGQLADLEFVLGHVNDLAAACAIVGPEVVLSRPEEPHPARSVAPGAQPVASRA
jgi:2-phosphosulfolactate phosphatase